MGHQINKRHRPRRGSLQFWPRVKAKRSLVSPRNYPALEENVMMAFAGYKAGMTQVYRIDNRKGSLSKGEEIVTPVTIVEVPPLKVLGLRVYDDKRVLGEEWISKLGKDVGRKLSLPKKPKAKDLQKLLDNATKIRLIVSTQPALIGLKKKVDIFEVQMGGNLQDAFVKAKELMGKEVNFSDVFGQGEMVDTLSVTKGKGFTGSIKRFGLRLLQHKAEKLKRKAASIGPMSPTKVSFKSPQFGQHGFHSRVEYNKEIISTGKGLNIEGGIPKYGVVKNDYVLIKGSVGGPKKRLIIFRKSIRGAKKVEPMSITEVVVSSQV